MRIANILGHLTPQQRRRLCAQRRVNKEPARSDAVHGPDRFRRLAERYQAEHGTTITEALHAVNRAHPGLYEECIALRDAARREQPDGLWPWRSPNGNDYDVRRQ